jgi:hypothetical protein
MNFGSSGFAERGVKFWEWDCISASGLLRVLGTGARISVDILELGSYLVGREELGFGQCFAEAVKEASSGQTKVISIRFTYFKFCNCFNQLLNLL